MTADKNQSEQMFCPSCEREFDPGLHFCPHDGSKLIVRSHDEMAGQTLDGRYKILHKLGEGGMGAVYKAQQVTTGKMVAIKIVAQHLSTDEATIRRFRREVSIQSKLEHPNIVTVIDFSQLPTGEYYFVMAFVTGISLQNLLLEDGRQDLKSFLDYAIQLCDGIEYAHRLGIVHRDLKGDNIIIAQMGHQKIVKILDFGIAKALQSGDELTTNAKTAQLTQQGRILGTPAYMSPEQAKGEINHIGPTTDIYSIGVIMFQMLAGKLPFESDTPWELMHKHIMSPVPSITGEGEAIGELNQIIGKCMEKEPEKRYQSALELKEVLEHMRAEYTRPGSTKNGDTAITGATQVKTAVYQEAESGELDATAAYQTPVPSQYAPPQQDMLKTAIYAVILILAVVAGGAGVHYFTKGKPPEITALTSEIQAPEPPTAGVAPEAQTTPEQRLSPNQTRAMKIAEALKTAKRRIVGGALTRPEGESALDSYRAVLALDAKNKEAKKGIADIGARLVAMVNDSVKKKNLGLAEDYLAQAKKHTPKARGIRQAEKRLDAQKEKQDRALAALANEENKQSQVTKWLSQGDSYLAAGALDSPPGKNASESYKTVLQIAPGHPKAHEGLEKVAKSALGLAARSLADKDYEKARAHIDTAIAAVGATEPALRMKEELHAAVENDKSQKDLLTRQTREAEEAETKRLAAETRQARETLKAEKQRLTEETRIARETMEAEKKRLEAATRKAREAMGADEDLKERLIAEAIKSRKAVEAQNRKKITSLLKQGEKAFYAGKLIKPGANSAMEIFTKAQDLDPDNEKALAGLRRIGRVLTLDAQKAVDYNDLEKAASLIAVIEKIDPTAPRLITLKGNLARVLEEKGIVKHADQSDAGVKPAHGEMIAVRGGCFWMGDYFKEGEPEELPGHTVCLEDFKLDIYEVTQAQFKKVMKTNPSKFNNCEDCPVESVTWEEAASYCASS
ncbi:MAG: protein kinase, partial [Nitrospinota bacterium]|nr:protein kinase [Nitrospinota bacterium]